MRRFDTLIIGAGASGLMAAGRYRDRDIAVLEAGTGPAQKIAISGGGRCNITNRSVTPENYVGDPLFVADILQGFDQKALVAWLEFRGLKPVLRKGSQYFCPRRATELVDLLLRECRDIPIMTQCRVSSVDRQQDRFVVESSRGTFEAKSLVVASGGLSFPKIGAGGIAFEIAEKFGHRVMTPKPALVGLTLQKEQFWMKALSGLSLPVSVKVAGKSIEGDLLFAHRGISGPAILNTSLYWQKGQIMIDYLPSRRLDATFYRSKKRLSTLLQTPKRFAKAFLAEAGISDIPACETTQKEREALAAIKAYRFAPAGTFGYSKAEVTLGGVSTDEIDPQTMQSRILPGLYFLGEALDVTGELGGYNFQWAFATAQRLRL